MKTSSIIAILFQLIYFNTVSQNISGKIYDEKSTAKGIKVYNKNKNNWVYSDEDGTFNIKVNVNDTLIFSSIFYNEKQLKILAQHFDTVMVIELTKIVNNLEEVLLTDIGKEKPFNETTYSLNLSNQIKNDIKNNRHLYGLMPSGGIDLVHLVSLISGLFKKKNKKETVTYADYKDLDLLFSKKNIFTKKLIVNDFKIPNEFTTLFFDYCASKNIDKTLLLPKNELALLNILFTYSEEFLLLLEDFTKMD